MNKGLLLLVFICAAVAQETACTPIEGYFKVTEATGKAEEEGKIQLKGSIYKFTREAGSTATSCTTKTTTEAGDITIKNGDKIELTFGTTTAECEKQEADNSLKCSTADATVFTAILAPFDTETNPNLSVSSISRPSRSKI